jgi:hypothetical protein
MSKEIPIVDVPKPEGKEEAMSEDYKVGDDVSWESQSQGSRKRKVGTVVQVVRAGNTPRITKVLQEDYRPMQTYGRGRKDVSYLVAVQPAEGNAKPVLYWPRASSLKLCITSRRKTTHFFVPEKMWVLIDRSNGDCGNGTGGLNYLWWFTSREAAREHLKFQRKNPDNATLDGPFRFVRAQ